jgi:hypothetical protein
LNLVSNQVCCRIKKSTNFYLCFFREVVLGEHIVGRDPDCQIVNGKKTCAPSKITRKVAKTFIHEDYQTQPPFPNDIALIRLDEAVPLHQENSTISSVVPVCLPWNNNKPGNKLVQGDKLLVVGWGRITNNKEQNREALLRNKVSTRTLQKLFVPIVGTNCSTQEIVKKPFDFTKQVCAGGETRKCAYSFIQEFLIKFHLQKQPPSP